jgi:peptidoglycan/xylan/chitin deacetylase (PgdA/CDA1 family)
MIARPLEIAAAGALTAGAITGALSYATFAGRSAWWGPLVWRGRRDGPPRVALTFDDGPWPGATDRVLDILGEFEVKAAFFVIGRYVEKHSELVARIHREGHLLGNHTFDHRGNAFLRGPRFWQEQLDRTDDAIERVIGVRPRLYRPPLGMKTPISARATARHHLVVTWTRSARDGLTTTPDRVLRRLLPRCQAGDILLLHDGVSPQSDRDPSVTSRALRPLILGLRARGIEPARVDEITGLNPYQPEPGGLLSPSSTQRD